MHACGAEAGVPRCLLRRLCCDSYLAGRKGWPDGVSPGQLPHRKPNFSGPRQKRTCARFLSKAWNDRHNSYDDHLRVQNRPVEAGPCPSAASARLHRVDARALPRRGAGPDRPTSLCCRRSENHPPPRRTISPRRRNNASDCASRPRLRTGASRCSGRLSECSSGSCRSASSGTWSIG